MFTTRPVCSFFVRGEPAPGGSKTFFPFRSGNGELVTYWSEGGKQMVRGTIQDAAGKRNKEWRKLVGWQAKDIFRGQVLNKPVKVAMTFYMPRPKSDFGTGRNAAILKPDADEFHMQDPDSTKLQRSTEDAMNEIAWKDDNQVQEITSRKLWNTDNEIAGHFHHCGCLIEIHEILSKRPVIQELNLETPEPPKTVAPRERPVQAKERPPAAPIEIPWD